MSRGRFRVLYLRPPDLDLDAFPRRIGKLAHQVARSYGLHGAAALEDLQSAGYVRALRLAREFRPSYPEGYRQPDNAFWGWAYREVLTEIQREAARLLAGGTIRSPRRTKDAPFVFARPMSDLADEDGDGVQLAAPDPNDDRKQPASRQDYQRFLALANRLGRTYADFLALASKLTDGDRPPVARPADGGGFVLEWADDRGPQALTIHPDGRLEHDAGE